MTSGRESFNFMQYSYTLWIFLPAYLCVEKFKNKKSISRNMDGDMFLTHFLRTPSKKRLFIYERLRRYVELSVPRTWLYATISFMFGYIISGQSDIILMLLGIFMYGPILTGATNLINMYYDTIEDEVNKPMRKKHLAVLGKENIRRSSFLLYGMALLISLFFRSIYFVISIFIYVIISYTYSAPPLRFKKRFMVSLVMLAYGSVFLPFVSAWAISGDFSSVPWGLIAFSTSIVMFPISGKDITDPIGDKKAGNKTIFTVMSFHEGVEFFCKYMLWMPYVVLFLLVALRLLPYSMLIFNIFIILTYIDTKNIIKIKTFVPEYTRKYFKSIFWHIILMLSISFLIFIFLSD
jgi:4-hydroxybenzoate polyprenyltransferase